MPDPFSENWLRFVRDIRPQFGGNLAGLSQAFGPSTAVWTGMILSGLRIQVDQVNFRLIFVVWP